MRKPYWKYFVVLYILITLANIISMLVGLSGGDNAPFGIGAEIISAILTSLLDLIPAAIIGAIVEFILRKFTEKTFVPNLAITVVVYEAISAIMHSL